jgi:hypothetical protein
VYYTNVRDILTDTEVFKYLSIGEILPWIPIYFPTTYMLNYHGEISMFWQKYIPDDFKALSLLATYASGFVKSDQIICLYLG